mmetsp:Transcript_30828/g.88352  ORF Transcript_30828/g.88352 Transcript_30828/m.88352 type:complete len:475 (+) Transcript_30828:56-1480(+)
MKRASPAARYAAELVGTFFLVVTVGCNLHAGSIGAALSIGCVVAAMVCALGSVSGAHLNPAITLAVWLSRRSGLRIGEALCFMLFQIFGGILGTFTYWGVIGQELRQRPLFPYSSAEAFSLEAIYAWALCYVFLNVMLTDADAKEARFSRPANGVAVGFTVTAAVVAIGPISGCCLNPAVTLGSYSVGRLLLANNRLALCCPYTFAPFVGSILGAFSFFLVRGGARGRYGEEEEWPREPAGRPREAAPRAPSLAEAVRRRPEDLGPPPWSLRISKQEPVVLPESFARHTLFCGLRWRMKLSPRPGGAVDMCDIDLSCVKFARGGACLGGVYFNEKEDADNGIYHSGDEVTGQEGLVDNELITFRLCDLKPSVHALLFTMTIYSSGRSFDDIEQCYLRLVDGTDGNKEFCRFEKDALTPGANALIAAMLYRTGKKWCFKAVDEIFTLPPNSSYRKLVPQMSDSVLQTSAHALREP